MLYMHLCIYFQLWHHNLQYLSIYHILVIQSCIILIFLGFLKASFSVKTHDYSPTHVPLGINVRNPLGNIPRIRMAEMLAICTHLFSSLLSDCKASILQFFWPSGFHLTSKPYKNLKSILLSLISHCSKFSCVNLFLPTCHFS